MSGYYVVASGKPKGVFEFGRFCVVANAVDQEDALNKAGKMTVEDNPDWYLGPRVYRSSDLEFAVGLAVYKASFPEEYFVEFIGFTDPDEFSRALQLYRSTIAHLCM